MYIEILSFPSLILLSFISIVYGFIYSCVLSGFGLLPAYGVWHLWKGKRPGSFWNHIRRYIFPLSVMVSFSVWLFFLILNPPVYITSVSPPQSNYFAPIGLLVPSILMGFSLNGQFSDFLPAFSSAFWSRIKENLFFIFMPIITAVGLYFLWFFSVWFQTGLMSGAEKEIVTAQLNNFYGGVFFPFVVFFLSIPVIAKLFDILLNPLETWFRDLVGELPPEYSRYEKETEKVGTGPYVQIFGVLILFVMAIYLFNVFTHAPILGELELTGLIQQRLILLSILLIEALLVLSHFRSVGKLLSFDIKEDVADHIVLRRTSGRTLTWVVAGFFVFSLFFLLLYGLQYYTGNIISETYWFSPAALRTLEATPRLFVPPPPQIISIFEGLFTHGLALEKAIFSLKYFFLLGEASLITFLFLYWQRSSTVRRGMKILVSVIVFSAVSIIGELVISGQIEHGWEHTLNTLVPTLLVLNGPKIVGWFEERAETIECPECGNRWRKGAESCAHCGFLINKSKILEKLDEEDKERVVDLDDILDEIKQKKEKSCSDRGTDLNIEGRGYKAKGNFLRYLFLSLVENSILHSRGDRIKISVEKIKNKIAVRIEDDGQGVSEEDKKRIFEKGFSKGEKAGFGLGTYLARRIAKKYAGEIDIEDSELGGVRFNIYLKRA